MDVAGFLFPDDLAVTETRIGKVLLIGSCLAEAYHNHFRAFAPQVKFDWILFNNIMDIPAIDEPALRAYDFQFVQLSLRQIISDDVIDFSGFLADGAAEAILIRARQLLQLTLDSALKYNKSHNLLTFVANFLVPQVPVVAALDQIGSAKDFTTLVRRLNEELAALVSQYQNVYLADIDAIGSCLGKRYFQEDVVGFYSHAAYWSPENYDFDTSPAFNAPSAGRIEPFLRIDEVYESHLKQMFRAVWRQLECLYRTVNQIDMVKLVIFDLDDTMWRGQIAEHYADGVAWPKVFGWPTGIWEAVQHLRARGIITALCSKNEESLVRARWGRAVLPWLTLEDFPLREINWRPKAENVAGLIRAASVTARSCVFVDDNPVERESVKAALPGIRVLGANPYVTRRVLLWSPETQLAFRSRESSHREQSIRQLQVRENDRAALSREAFLQSLGCVVAVGEIASASDPEFSRCVELLNKTNQFNTTGIRWNTSQIKAFMEMDGKIFFFDVRDKYTDYGIVGVILYRCGVFVQFAMSCRVLGLEIETSVIHAIMARRREAEGCGEFHGRVFETDANMVCRNIFTRCGFAAKPGSDSLYVWQQGLIPPPAEHLRMDVRLPEVALA